MIQRVKGSKDLANIKGLGTKYERIFDARASTPGMVSAITTGKRRIASTSRTRRSTR